MPTLAQWLNGSPLPKSEARLLLQHAGGLTAAQLITRSDDLLSDGLHDTLEQLVCRRLGGEPVAYILGWREFYGRRFSVGPEVLIPRHETEHLVDALLQHLPPQGRVWDLGTGSGIIAVTAALECRDASVCASDISTAALDTARLNARNLGADVAFAQGSWFDAPVPGRNLPFDVIVSNPPYIEAGDRHLQQGDLRFEPQQALTDFSDGLSCIRILAAGAFGRLKPDGLLLMEHGCDQGAAVRLILQRHGYTDTATLPDLAGLDRITLGRRP